MQPNYLAIYRMSHRNYFMEIYLDKLANYLESHTVISISGPCLIYLPVIYVERIHIHRTQLAIHQYIIHLCLSLQNELPLYKRIGICKYLHFFERKTNILQWILCKEVMLNFQQK